MALTNDCFREGQREKGTGRGDEYRRRKGGRFRGEVGWRQSGAEKKQCNGCRIRRKSEYKIRIILKYI